eukprot:gene591-875_t
MKPRSEQSIPADVLRLILSRVDQSHRQKNCALVSKAWRAAAATATTSVRISFYDEVDTVKPASLWRWLRQQGRQSLIELKVSGWARDSGGGFYDLPFDEQLKLPQLQDLYIMGNFSSIFGVDSNIGSNPVGRQQNPFAGMPGLTALRLLHIEFKCSINGLAALSLLTRLQELELFHVQLPPDQLEERENQVDMLPWTMRKQVPVHPVSFQQLTQLTSLSFDVDLCGKFAVAPLSCLQQLQVLNFNGAAVSQLGVLLGLPQSLRRLGMSWGGGSVLSSNTAPSLAALTSLKQLNFETIRVEAGVIHPSLLTGMQQLQELKLVGLATDALPALLEVMPMLRELRVLDITDDNAQLGGGVQPLPAAQVEQYSKLLPASSQLSSVTFTTSNSQMLTQEGCMEQVFNPARQLDSLKELVLDLSFPAAADENEPDEPQSVFATLQLLNLASCCPNLTKLHLPGLILPGADKRILLHWKKSLTSLAVGGIAFTDASVTAVLLKMTNLHELIIKNSPSVSDLGLLSLTALTKLTELKVANCGLSEDIETDDGVLRLLSGRIQPRVWLKVQNVCRRSEVCWRYVNDQLAEEKAATQRYRQLLGSARAQAAAAKAKLRGVCERLRDVAAACKKGLAESVSARQPGTEQAAGLPVQEEGAESQTQESDNTIKKILARQIYDSRGKPTVEVDLYTGKGMFRAAVPSGKSTGIHEAYEMRDGDKSRNQGAGVLNAVRNVNDVLAPALLGCDVTKQVELDQKMIELDGTENKSKLGANGILAISIAACRAGAAARGVPLYQHIADLAGNPRPVLPVPSFNVINGGVHAGNTLAPQEFMILPVGAPNFAEAMRMGSETYHTLRAIIQKKYGLEAVNVGDEGGFAPPIDSFEAALDLLTEAISEA